MRYREIILEDGRIVRGVNTTPDVGVDQISIEAMKFGNRVDRGGVPKNRLMEDPIEAFAEKALQYDTVEKFIRGTDGMDVLYRGHSDDHTPDNAFMSDYVGHAAEYADDGRIDAFAFQYNDVMFFNDERFDEMRKHYRNHTPKQIAAEYQAALSGNRHAVHYEDSLKLVRRLLRSEKPYSTFCGDHPTNDQIVPLMQKYARDNGRNIISFLGNDYADYGGQNEYVVGDVSQLVDLRKVYTDAWANRTAA